MIVKVNNFSDREFLPSSRGQSVMLVNEYCNAAGRQTVTGIGVYNPYGNRMGTLSKWLSYAPPFQAPVEHNLISATVWHVQGSFMLLHIGEREYSWLDALKRA